MGAWGMTSFENDGALGLLADVIHGDDLRPVKDALEQVLENDDYIEVDEAQEAVAAGEVVALLLGKSGEKLPERLMVWKDAHPLTVEDTLREQAAHAVEKVYSSSEMRELWEDTPDFAAWEAVVVDLIGRLKTASAWG